MPDGVSLWRQVFDQIWDDIESSRLNPGERLPSHSELAVKFGVNPHTVRRALHQLKDEGFLRIEQGRGIFVAEGVLTYRVGLKNRFIENVSQQGKDPKRHVVKLERLKADRQLARELGVKPGSLLLLAYFLGESDSIPVSLVRTYFRNDEDGVLERKLEDHLNAPEKLFDLAKVLKTIGVKEYRRVSLRIEGRRATTEEGHFLKVPDTEYVLDMKSKHLDENGDVVLYSSSTFPSSRVVFEFDPSFFG